MSSVFRVLEVFRPQQRKGPILVGQVPSVNITIGTRLVLADDTSQVVEVVGVDLPTPKSLREGRLAVVVQPDLGDQLRSGAIFHVIDPGPGTESRVGNSGA